MRNSPNAGFSLVEILIVIAIIGLLASITLVFEGAQKESSLRTVDIGNLRQIGVCGALYEADYDDRMTYSVVQLVRSGRIPASIAISPNDPSQVGLGNEILRNRGIQGSSSKVSYLSFSDPGSDRDPKTLNGDGSVGWVAALLPPFKNDYSNGTFFVLPGDKFLRLRMDGGVIQKDAIWKRTHANGIDDRSFDFLSLYVDKT